MTAQTQTDPIEHAGTWQWQIARFPSPVDGVPDTIIGKLEKQNGEAEQVSVKGLIPADEQMEKGLSYRFFGKWMTHHKYGRQFVFESVVLASPVGEIGTVAYLSRKRGVGIGKVIAQRIWNRYGPDSLSVLRDKPQGVAANIVGLSATKAEEASRYFKSIEGQEQVTIELTQLFQGRGFPRTTTQQSIAKWQNRAPEYIRENPYLLLQFRGIGWPGADKLYLDLGHDPAAIERQGRCVVYGLQSARDGHTWYPESHAKAALLEHVAGADIDVAGAIEWAIKESEIVDRCWDGNWLADREKAADESAVAFYIREVLAEESWPPTTGLPRLTDHQDEQLAIARSANIGILAGRPGTGKTFSTAAFIRSLGDNVRVEIAAPTGKAAVRIMEALHENGVRKHATTIHRMLGVEPTASGRFRFVHDRNKRLPARLIIIDEASMISTDLMASLMAARDKDTRILFVGDPEQLPPVGHGAPLRDMIAAGVPCGYLKEIHRNAGRIVKECKRISEEKTIGQLPAQLDLGNGENLVLYSRGNPKSQMAELRRVLTTIKDGGTFDPVWDVQVLVAVNEASKISRVALNAELQAMLNPDGETAGKNPFRLNDKVVCLRNGLRQPLGRSPDTGEQIQQYIANGDIGRVIDVTPMTIDVELFDPQRLVRIPLGGEGSQSKEWTLAYALSGHKSQGSEWPIVLVMLDDSYAARAVCTRQWLYTVLSRAKVACGVIGMKSAALAMCGRDGMKRKTFLSELIKGEEHARVAS
tara:strand:- start:1907 stop:4174 length:2268 start_codon:yes stop_codon:yes gene_type:complete